MPSSASKKKSAALADTVFACYGAADHVTARAATGHGRTAHTTGISDPVTSHAFARLPVRALAPTRAEDATVGCRVVTASSLYVTALIPPATCSFPAAVFFFKYPPTTEISTLSLPAALPISRPRHGRHRRRRRR